MEKKMALRNDLAGSMSVIPHFCSTRVTLCIVIRVEQNPLTLLPSRAILLPEPDISPF